MKENGATAPAPVRRMYVKVREVPLAQRHEVPTGAQVGLDGNRLTITRHREAKLDLPAG